MSDSIYNLHITSQSFTSYTLQKLNAKYINIKTIKYSIM